MARHALIPLAAVLVAIAPRHPHGNLPLLTYTQRAREFVDAKPGATGLAAIDRRFRAGWPPGASLPASGAFAAQARRLAARGQVDLFQHLFSALSGDEVADASAVLHINKCEACSAVSFDAAAGDPEEVRRLPLGKTGILPITAHNFLGAKRDSAAAKLTFLASAQNAQKPRPAGVDFFDKLPEASASRGIVNIDHNVARRIGFDRLDLDGDGSLETERLDLDDDGKYEVYHVDRDRDGAFEIEAIRGEDGKWNIKTHGELLDAHQRALDALLPKAEDTKSGGAQSKPMKR